MISPEPFIWTKTAETDLESGGGPLKRISGSGHGWPLLIGSPVREGDFAQQSEQRFAA
jgi:hypothetical protein